MLAWLDTSADMSCQETRIAIADQIPAGDKPFRVGMCHDENDYNINKWYNTLILKDIQIIWVSNFWKPYNHWILSEDLSVGLMYAEFWIIQENWYYFQTFIYANQNSLNRGLTTIWLLILLFCIWVTIIRQNTFIAKSMNNSCLSWGTILL